MTQDISSAQLGLQESFYQCSRCKEIRPTDAFSKPDPEDPEDLYVTCNVCRTAKAAAENERKQKARDEDKCTRCYENPTQEGRAWCNQCLKNSSDHKQKAKNDGKCVNCYENAPEGRVYCSKCLKAKNDSENERKQEARGEGKCTECKNETPLSNAERCFTCKFKSAIRKAGGSQKDYNAWVKTLYFDKNCLCFFCGDPLNGSDLSIAHLRAIARTPYYIKLSKEHPDWSRDKFRRCSSKEYFKEYGFSGLAATHEACNALQDVDEFETEFKDKIISYYKHNYQKPSLAYDPIAQLAIKIAIYQKWVNN